MAREDDALARRAAREARRALLEERNGKAENGDGDVGAGRAVREAAAAAAAAAAAGAVKALAGRHGRGQETEERDEQDERVEPGDSEAEAQQPDEEEDDDVEDEPRAAAPPPGRRRPREGVEPGQVGESVRRAREQLAQLNGVEAESVSSFERTPDGFRVTLEVLELRRIPETTDVLASYVVELDGDGNLQSYARMRRYQRSEALDGGDS